MITIKDEVPKPDLPNWEKFGKLIEKSPNDILRVAHTTVRSRLGFAGMHLSILRQAENISMIRAMSEDVMINLMSSLEAMGHILNAFYALGIDYYSVTIYHKSYHNEKKHKEQTKSCLRCRLNEVNSPLGDFLDKFLKTGSPVEDWFNGLIEYRNQILHRQHLIAYSTSNGYFLPDDPSILGPQGGYFDRERKRFVTGNFTKRRRIKEYTEFLYEIVMEVIEDIFAIMVEEYLQTN